jgi:hypothetical protein
MILKLPGLLYFLTEGQTDQDMHSNRVVMILSDTSEDVSSALKLRNGQTVKEIGCVC